ncbi:alpha/beta fold hydrolase [Patescibacteria group bacterium]|nr:alpha/beta fold hydrolase [Patescibacteria group bacterium]
MMKRIVTVITLAVFLIGGLLVWRQRRDADSGAIFQQTLKVFKPDSENQPISSNPLAIENLRKRVYEGSGVTIEQTLSRNASYTAYRVSYLSDGLKIFAAMNVPQGDGPFPVVVLNHGYFNPAAFKTGDGTRTMADILAKNGYLTLASDYRGHGESDSDGVSRGHRAEYSTDIVNLIASIKNVEQANPEKIGIWGHSMGGEMTLKVLEISEQIKAAVLWAPTSGNAQRNYNRWARRFGGDRAQHQDRRFSEPPDLQTLRENSSANYLGYISAPIQLHHGTADTEVPYDWSVELNKNLEEAGKEIEFFTYEGQDHNFKNLGWGEISPRTVEFFDKNVKGLSISA